MSSKRSVLFDPHSSPRSPKIAFRNFERRRGRRTFSSPLSTLSPDYPYDVSKTRNLAGGGPEITTARVPIRSVDCSRETRQERTVFFYVYIVFFFLTELARWHVVTFLFILWMKSPVDSWFHTTRGLEISIPNKRLCSWPQTLSLVGGETKAGE